MKDWSCFQSLSRETPFSYPHRYRSPEGRCGQNLSIAQPREVRLQLLAKRFVRPMTSSFFQSLKRERPTCNLTLPDSVSSLILSIAQARAALWLPRKRSTAGRGATTPFNRSSTSGSLATPHLCQWLRQESAFNRPGATNPAVNSMQVWEYGNALGFQSLSRGPSCYSIRSEK